MMEDYFVLAFKNLKKRKLRAWLTMLGIFISIATIFLLVSVSIGLQESVQEQFRILGTDKFFIMPKGQVAGPGTAGAATLTEADVDVIDRVQGVKEVSYMNLGNVEVEFKSKKRFLMIVGYPLETQNLINEMGFYKIDEGKFLREGETGKVMVGSLYAAGSVFPSEVHQGNTITINGLPFKVQAVLQPIGSPQDDKLIYMSIEDFKKLFNDTDRADQIVVQINAGENITDVAAKVDKKLMNFRGLDRDTKDYTVSTPEELLASFGVILNIITAFLLGVAGISLVVGGIGIANTMYTSVLERTREIGVMKAIGARNRDVMGLFLIESGLLGLIGGIIGVVLGYLLSKVVEFIAQQALGSSILSVASPWYLFAGLLIFAFFIGALFGVWPAYRASKIIPVKALRYQ
jgi:putative ABC transport system permease protein